MASLRASIVRLRAFAERIAHPHDFYAQHAPHWLGVAQRITKAAVIALRPPDEFPETWALKADTLASKVGYSLHELPLAGLTIRLADGGGADPATPGSPAHASQGLSIEDLMRFVREGRQGNPLGKRLDERDTRKTKDGVIEMSDAEIAWRMMFAIKRRADGWDRLKHVVDTFLGSTAGGNTDGIADAILKTWLSVLVPLARQDWEGWLSRRARGI